MPALRPGGDFSVEIVEERPGLLVFCVTGARAEETFKDEAGGHRFQRVPENDKRGRVHTSTITVALMSERQEVQVEIPDGDLEWKMIRGSGAGGQARNKVSNAIQLRHLPTNTLVRCESGRSLHQNKQTALAALHTKLQGSVQGRLDEDRASDRKQQIGTGMRGDKTWSIDVPEDRVVHHPSGKRMRFRDYVRGNWD